MPLTNGIVKAIAGAAGEVMKGLDGLFTSDDERNAAKVRVEEVFNTLADSVLNHVEAQEKERSDRHNVDMNSDSWLSKNIRPLALIYLSVLFTALAITDSITAIQFDVADKYVSLLRDLLLAVFSFYFVARGIEKVAQSIKEMKTTKINIQ